MFGCVPPCNCTCVFHCLIVRLFVPCLFVCMSVICVLALISVW